MAACQAQPGPQASDYCFQAAFRSAFPAAGRFDSDQDVKTVWCTSPWHPGYDCWFYKRRKKLVTVSEETKLIKTTPILR
jgi:hypothetical protein